MRFKQAYGLKASLKRALSLFPSVSPAGPLSMLGVPNPASQGTGIQCEFIVQIGMAKDMHIFNLYREESVYFNLRGCAKFAIYACLYTDCLQINPQIVDRLFAGI